MRVFPVLQISFSPFEGGSVEDAQVFKVFGTVNEARSFVKKQNDARASSWSPELRFDDEEGFEVESTS